MPTYTYKCLNCQEVFDLKASIREKEENKSEKFICPKCRSKNIRQEFSALNFLKNVFNNSEKTGGCCSGETGQSQNREPDKRQGGCGCGCDNNCCG